MGKPLQILNCHLDIQRQKFALSFVAIHNRFNFRTWMNGSPFTGLLSAQEI